MAKVSGRTTVALLLFLSLLGVSNSRDIKATVRGRNPIATNLLPDSTISPTAAAHNESRTNRHGIPRNLRPYPTASPMASSRSKSRTNGDGECDTDAQCTGTLHCGGLEYCYNHVCTCPCCL